MIVLNMRNNEFKFFHDQNALLNDRDLSQNALFKNRDL